MNQHRKPTNHGKDLWSIRDEDSATYCDTWRFLFCSILYYSISLECRRGITDDFATIPFHLVLFSAALVKLAKSIPAHSLTLSCHLSFCLPLLLFPFTVPFRTVFATSEDLETWPSHRSFHDLTMISRLLYSPMAVLVFLRSSSLVTGSLYEIFNSLRQHLMSMAAFFSLTLLSRCTIHRHRETWKWQESASTSPLIFCWLVLV